MISERLFNLMVKRTRLTNIEEKIIFIKEAIPYISQLGDQFELENALKLLANKYKISEEAILIELSRYRMEGEN